MTLDRREFLRGLAALAGLLAAGCPRGHGAVETLLVELVHTLAVPDPSRVGRRLLESEPGLHDVESLCEEIFGELPIETAADSAELARTFRDKVRGELEAGRFALADGWLLAPSEARLCALLAAGHETAS